MLDEMRLVDEFGNVYYSAGVIGIGGQGVVLRTRDSDIAVKLLLDATRQPLSDPAERNGALQRLHRLRVLPVPRGLPLAGPVAALRNHAGYVMRLLDGMRSFKDIFESPCPTEQATHWPSWLEGVGENDPSAAALLADYAMTGSTKVRLLQLARCAAVLARLHAAGLVYGDLSSSNVLTSCAEPEAQVWLIDADNLAFDGDADAANGFFTSGFGAPELVRAECAPSMRTDAHAFAVLAFKLLRLAHPFIGRMVEEGANWSDPGADMEQQAMSGLLPWIHDADPSNHSEKGLPPMLVCTPRMRDLFDECFGAGRTMPWRRPAMLHWPQALAAGADASIDCGACSMSYFALEHAHCPYCKQARPRLLRLDSLRWTDDASADAPHWTLLLPLYQLAQPVMLPARLFSPFSLAEFEEPVLSLQSEDGGYRLRRLRDAGPELRIARRAGDAGRFAPLENFHLADDELAAGVAIFAAGTQPRLVRMEVMEAT